MTTLKCHVGNERMIKNLLVKNYISILTKIAISVKKKKWKLPKQSRILIFEVTAI